MSNWISVKDRLPFHENKRYLCYDYNQGLEKVCEWIKGYFLETIEWTWFLNDDDFIVTHWQPLPTPPERS